MIVDADGIAIPRDNVNSSKSDGMDEEQKAAKARFMDLAAVESGSDAEAGEDSDSNLISDAETNAAKSKSTKKISNADSSSSSASAAAGSGAELTASVSASQSESKDADDTENKSVSDVNASASSNSEFLSPFAPVTGSDALPDKKKASILETVRSMPTVTGGFTSDDLDREQAEQAKKAKKAAKLARRRRAKGNIDGLIAEEDDDEAGEEGSGSNGDDDADDDDEVDSEADAENDGDDDAKNTKPVKPYSKNEAYNAAMAEFSAAGAAKLPMRREAESSNSSSSSGESETDDDSAEARAHRMYLASLHGLDKAAAGASDRARSRLVDDAADLSDGDGGVDGAGAAGDDSDAAEEEIDEQERAAMEQFLTVKTDGTREGDERGRRVVQAHDILDEEEEVDAMMQHINSRRRQNDGSADDGREGQTRAEELMRKYGVSWRDYEYDENDDEAAGIKGNKAAERAVRATEHMLGEGHKLLSWQKRLIAAGEDVKNETRKNHGHDLELFFDDDEDTAANGTGAGASIPNTASVDAVSSGGAEMGDDDDVVVIDSDDNNTGADATGAAGKSSGKKISRRKAARRQMRKLRRRKQKRVVDEDGNIVDGSNSEDNDISGDDDDEDNGNSDDDDDTDVEAETAGSARKTRAEAREDALFSGEIPLVDLLPLAPSAVTDPDGHARFMARYRAKERELKEREAHMHLSLGLMSDEMAYGGAAGATLLDVLSPLAALEDRTGTSEKQSQQTKLKGPSHACDICYFFAIFIVLTHLFPSLFLPLARSQASPGRSQ